MLTHAAMQPGSPRRLRQPSGSAQRCSLSLAARLLLLSVCAATAAAESDAWRLCNDQAAAMAVSGAVAMPAVAHAGEHIEFRVDGTAERPVPGGTLEVSVAYRGFRVHSEKGDLCAAVACPMAPGPQSVVLARALPRTAPPGPYQLTVRITGEGGQLVLCVEIKFSVRLRGGPLRALAAAAKHTLRR